MPSFYAIFKPGTFGLAGYAYGVSDISDPAVDPVHVELVRSGQWAGASAPPVSRPRSELVARQVDEAEALVGPSTFMGTYVCAPRTPPRAGRQWDYGIVVGTRWDASTSGGFLTIAFANETVELPCDVSHLQVLAVETYAMRPCTGQLTLDLLPAEMRALNEQVYEHFNGIGRSSTRSLKAIFQRANLPPPAEDLLVGLFENNRVIDVPVKYVLDFVYYHVNHRRAPRTVRLGASLTDFAGPRTRGQHAASPAGSESDGGESDDSQPPPPKRSRRSATVPEPLSQPNQPPVPPNQPPPVQPSQHSPADELTGAVAGAQASVVDRSRDASLSFSSPFDAEDRHGDRAAQFRPSTLSRSIHTAIVNGKFRAFSPQLLVETMQAQPDQLPFLLHPGTLCGLYSWEFGLHGLSIMHFRPLEHAVRQAEARRHRMKDFKHKNTAPQAADALSVGDIIDACDGLSSATSVIFGDLVARLMQALRAFLVQLKLSQAFTTPDAAQELVTWIDERFQHFRSLLAAQDSSSADDLRQQFQMGHSSYFHVVQRITEHRLRELCQSAPRSAAVPGSRVAFAAPEHRVQASAGHGGSTNNTTRRTSVGVPADVRASLPHEHGKQLCMKFLSTASCRGRGGNCVYDSRAHFVPTGPLAPNVRQFIEANYGGLKQQHRHL